MEDLLPMAGKVLRAFEARGVEGEVYLARVRKVSAVIENDQVVRAETTLEEGLGIRVSLQCRIGFAYTNRLKMEELERLVDRGLKLARASEPLEGWKGFPRLKPYGKASEIFDGEVAEAEVGKAVEMASEMLREALSLDKRVKASDGGVSLIHEVRAVANSQGVEAIEEGTWVRCSLETLGKEGLKTTPACFEFDYSRRLNVNPARVGREAGRLALSALGAEKVEGGWFPVVLGQPALLSLLSYTLMPALKADNVQRGKSPLAGRVGEKIFSELLTLEDDGRLPGGLRSSSFDDEGVPSRKTMLVEGGVLKGFLYDHYWASRVNVESTGNGFRASHASTPTIEPSNITVKPSSKSVEDLLSEVEYGFYVPYLQGAHSSNPESGEFSVVAAPAWLIKGGHLTQPVRSIMLAGTIYELLGKVCCLASNARAIGFLVAPWMAVEKVRVVGE